MTQTLLTSTSAAIQAFTVPSGWVASNNEVQIRGPGGNGSARQSSTRAGCGGGAGSFAKSNNLNLTAGDIIYYFLPAAGSALDAWFNDLNLLRATTNNIGTSPWFLDGTTVTQSQTDPLGGTTATFLKETAVTAGFTVLQDGVGNTALSKPVSTAITISHVCQLKPINGRNAQITFYDTSGANGAGVNIDLTNGTINGSAFTFGSGWSAATLVGITATANGFYRVIFQATVNNASTTFAYQIRILDATFTSTYAGNVNNGLHIYGSNCTYGTKDKGFTPTTTLAKYSVLAKCGTNATISAAGVGQTGSQGDITFQGGSGNRPIAGVTTGGGGGGAAGPFGAGSTASTSTGGAANNSTVAGSAAGNNGVAGSEVDATHGSGSGAGGRAGGTGNGFIGGNYGAGGSGCGTAAAGVGGAGAPSLIVYRYKTAQVKQGVSWKFPITLKVKDAGTWKAPLAMSVNVAGTWTQVYP